MGFLTSTSTHVPSIHVNSPQNDPISGRHYNLTRVQHRDERLLKREVLAIIQ